MSIWDSIVDWVKRSLGGSNGSGNPGTTPPSNVICGVNLEPSNAEGKRRLIIDAASDEWLELRDADIVPGSLHHKTISGAAAPLDCVELKPDSEVIFRMKRTVDWTNGVLGDVTSPPDFTSIGGKKAGPFNSSVYPH